MPGVTPTEQLRYWIQAIRGLVRRPDFAGARSTPRRLWNLYLARWEHRNLRVRLRSRPIKLIIEPTNICNLGCPACFTGDGQVGRARGHFPLETYRKLLAELGPYLWRIDFCNWGEPLLGRHIFPMIEEATARGVSSLISTNFSLPFDAARAERLVRSGLSVLGVSIDGARQETYEQYRIGGDLETVLRNCRLVLEARRRLRSKRPQMLWSFHVFPHNTDDIEPARRMAAELEMLFVVEKGWVVGEEWDPDGRYAYFSDPRPFPCTFLWSTAVVHNDGGIAPCCGTFYREDDLGRLETSFAAVWNGPAYQAARRLYHARAGDERLRKSVCFDCPQTVIWERWQQHLADGGTPDTFVSGYGLNDVFHYFWRRRPETARRHPAHATTPAAHG
jgi:pyruvate-formate lyase-activating enzyme